MIRSLVLTCCAILGLIVAAVGFGGSLPRADLVYVNPSGIHTLDPARMSWTQDFRVAINLWEGLTTLDPRTTEPVEGAAYFPPDVSDDRRTYTFTIRENARWSNGDPVTAGDFVRGWRRAIEPGTATDYAFLFTDHVVGAAEYVQWRQDAVTTLSALRSLQSGLELEGDSARALSRDDVFRRVSGQLNIAAPPGTDDLQEWEQWARQPRTAAVDWRTIRSTVLHAHASQLDEKFSDVGIHAANDTTLIVELSRPCSYFLDLTALPAFLPCHESIERLRLSYDGLPVSEEGLVVYDPQWTKPRYSQHGYGGLVTNGAYRLAEWGFKQRELAANVFYRNAGEVSCKTVDMLEYGSVSASLMAYERGDVDLLTDLTVPYDHELYRLLRSGERPDFHLCDVSATYFLSFNCLNDRINGSANPFLDPLVRKAFTLATDRATLVRNVIARGDRVAFSFVPPGLSTGYTPPAGLSYSPEDARRALHRAGVATGDQLGPIELLCTFNDERIAQALGRMWGEALGVQVLIRTQESTTFSHEKAKHHFTIAHGNWYADYGDPTTFLNCLQSGNGNNDSGYSSERYDELLRRAEQTVDESERFGLLRAAEEIVLLEDCPILPILHYTQMVATSSSVRGLYPNSRLWFPFQYVTVDR